MRDLYRMLDRIARGTISVLLLGETGVGKEVLAERIHRSSPRSDAPFVKLNCAAFSETLIESELFGHEKGAFTGADAAKPGLFEAAEGGSVFLDEVGEMPAVLQAKLLRVLEQRQVMRVGSIKPRAIDVRVIAATNRDLEVEVSEGRFRSDLFYRLNGISIVVPSLKERPSEIKPLAEMFIARIAKDLGRGAPVLTLRSVELLERYDWPGNIRELRNVMERAVLLAPGDEIEVEHLPVEKMTTAWLTGARTTASQSSEPPPPGPQPQGGRRSRAHRSRPGAVRRQSEPRRQGARHLTPHAAQPVDQVQHPPTAQALTHQPGSTRDGNAAPSASARLRSIATVLIASRKVK